MAALIFPLGLCGLSLAAYNFIRFDNAFETGMSYQLTIELASGTQYSFSYILSNLYLYLLSPLLPSSFPFFPTKHFQPGVVPGWASLPVGKAFEDVFTGLLPSVPLVWLLIPLVLALVVFYSITRNNPPVYEYPLILTNAGY